MNACYLTFIIKANNLNRVFNDIAPIYDHQSNFIYFLMTCKKTLKAFE